MIEFLKSNIVLLGALIANVGIAIAKFVAATLTGSSSMLSEGIHSVVDSFNQVLLLFGEHRSARPPDRKHPFGYGRELYFYAFVVAILIFGAGAGLSFYEGLIHYRHPAEMTDPTVNYIVLAVAFCLEGTSWIIAMREFAEAKGDLGWFEGLRASKDPSVFVVLFEDSAALLGLIIAALGVFLSHWLDLPWLDGVASMAIGVLLAVVATLLARETKALLIGESADPEVVQTIRDVISRHDYITAVNHVRTIHTAPRTIVATLSVDFRDDLTMGESETLIEELEDKLEKAVPQLSFIYIRPEKAENAITSPKKGTPAPSPET